MNGQESTNSESSRDSDNLQQKTKELEEMKADNETLRTLQNIQQDSHYRLYLLSNLGQLSTTLQQIEKTLSGLSRYLAQIFEVNTKLLAEKQGLDTKDG